MVQHFQVLSNSDLERSGDVVLRQKLYLEIIKHLTTSLLWRFYDVILYFRLCSTKKVENPNFFVFKPICLKFDTGGNFEMLITKSNPKLKLENDLSRKMQFFNNFRKKKLPRTLQQLRYHGNSGCSMGQVCIQNSSLLVYSKSLKVSAEYCLPFQHSKGKNKHGADSAPPPRPV